MTFKRLSNSFYSARAVDNGFVQLLVSGVSKADKFTRLFFFLFSLVGALQQNMTEVQLQAVLIYCKTRVACRRDLSPPAAPPSRRDAVDALNL